ncbi:hypothetical protein Kisp01_41070 [Kineosporia sp. NBRC 101677]|uniref:hypothetical protein n=1 Tax=Kineosporia sp. NBRC 101677 TaxID=3032197 RepID=UPI0024A0C135|nr:hypothetical protein [Kineosporia sp. NBRC 101677]GLY17092.1 hypothetical protein Kisp01_41070 [Kineosporia sp. NBRC 101677]
MLTKPAGPYMAIQPKPRISEEMKNGHCMAAAKNPPRGSLVRTTTTAIGTAINSDSTVVRAAKRAVLRMTSPKPASRKSRT